MANEEPRKSPTPQHVPLSNIHDLPGVTIPKQPDISYGGLVSSIQAKGVQEPVILRKREDGEYQLVTGYRRRRASELAKLKDIPALVYDMTLKDATDYHIKVKAQPNMPIPGKLIPEEKTQEAVKQGNDAVKQSDSKEPAKAEFKNAAPTKPTDAVKAPKDTIKQEAPKEPNKGAAPEAAPTKSTTPPKKEDSKEPVKATAPEPSPAKPTDVVKAAKDAVKQEDTKEPASKKKDAKETEDKKAEAPTGPVAVGPAGTTITKVLESKFSPPDEKALKDLELPKEGEAFSVLLHPGYLRKADINTFSVDRESDDFKELYKSIETFGVKDPVLARPNKDGTLDIISGQRRHLIASELNYPVPTIIQRMDDDDAKILVADGNLHREKISTYDQSRALRMKMDALKHKAGRKKKGEVRTLNTDEALAKEMGMSVSKLDRIVRLSEATREVCSRVDDGSLTLSVASAISFLKPANQDKVLNLMDVGYKVTNERIERMKKTEKSGKLTEATMRSILEDKDLIVRKVPTPTVTPTSVAVPSAPASFGTGISAPKPSVPSAPVIPTSPDVSKSAPSPISSYPSPTISTPKPEPSQSVPADVNPFKGEQEKPYVTKVILTGDRLRKYFPDVEMTPREIEESVYEALEERRQRQERQKQKTEIFKGGKSTPAR